MTKFDYLALPESAIRALVAWQLDAACNELVMPFDCWPTEFCPSVNLLDAARATAAMSDRGYWMRVISPDMPGGDWFCGFTEHGSSGWNGRPDIEASGPTETHARTLAAVLAAWREECDAI